MLDQYGKFQNERWENDAWINRFLLSTTVQAVMITCAAWCQGSLCWVAACRWGRRYSRISETTSRPPSAPPLSGHRPTFWTNASWDTASLPPSSPSSPLRSSVAPIPFFQVYSSHWLWTQESFVDIIQYILVAEQTDAPPLKILTYLITVKCHVQRLWPGFKTNLRLVCVCTDLIINILETQSTLI